MPESEYMPESESDDGVDEGEDEDEDDAIAKELSEV